MKEKTKEILKNKNVCFLGSSVTYGYASGGISFVDVIAKDCGCNCSKYAVNGTTLVREDENSYVSRLEKIDETGAFDLFVCQLSTNDASRNKPLGSEDDDSPDTVCGAINYVVEYVKARFGCPIVFFTNPPYDNARYAAMRAALLNIAKKKDFAVVDLFGDQAGKIPPSDRLKYMADDIHPTLSGYEEWWAPIFESALADVLSGN